MKLKNTTHKVVSVGETTILPGQSAEVKGNGFDKNPAIDFLVKKKILAVVKDTAAPKRK